MFIIEQLVQWSLILLMESKAQIHILAMASGVTAPEGVQGYSNVCRMFKRGAECVFGRAYVESSYMLVHV